MSRRSVAAASRSATWRRRLLAVEACFELVRARVLTLLPPRVYTKSLGEPCKTPADPITAHTPDEAAEIGKVVANTAARLPFRAMCLEQVIAVRRMLRRRDCAPVIFLGVREENITDAHAWLTVGRTVISGDGDLSAFRILTAFR